MGFIQHKIPFIKKIGLVQHLNGMFLMPQKIDLSSCCNLVNIVFVTAS